VIEGADGEKEDSKPLRRNTELLHDPCSFIYHLNENNLA